MSEGRFLAAPCGLYCGVCGSNLMSHECHGCGCDCGACAGAAHAEGCRIARCAADRGYATCAASAGSAWMNGWGSSAPTGPTSAG